MTEYLIYILTTAVTPGPNCIVSLSNASQKGFPKCLSLNFGMFAGTATVDIISFFLVTFLVSALPSVRLILQICGIIYLVYLSICLAKKGRVSIGDKTGGFRTGFLMQFVNVKVMMLSVTANSIYVLSLMKSTLHGLLLVLIIPLICLFCTLLWAVAGVALSSIYNKHSKGFNVFFALTLFVQAVINTVKLFN